MPGNYILDAQGQPVLEPNLLAWAQWFETAERHVAETTVGAQRVSTVFLGMDHNFSGQGPPILWETCIFTGGEADVVDRYTTRVEAEAGHAEQVRLLSQRN